MITAYDAGAKYVVVFNYPEYPPGNQYGILTEEHFLAMEKFWNYVTSSPRRTETANMAYVLPEDYGWGMRNPDDKIWGIWNADEKSPVIWENVNILETKYGLKFNIIYKDPEYNPEGKYIRIYFWNATID